MTFRLRDAAPGDVPLLRRFIGELAAYEKLTHEVRITEAGLHDALFGAMPSAHALLAEVAGAPVGYAIWLFKFNSFAGRSTLYLEDIFVAPAHRGGGIGRAIFRHLARLAVAQGSVRLDWVVLDWNAPSIGFYRGLGAEPLQGWTTYGVTGEALAALAGEGT